MPIRPWNIQDALDVKKRTQRILVILGIGLAVVTGSILVVWSGIAKTEDAKFFTGFILIGGLGLSLLGLKALHLQARLGKKYGVYCATPRDQNRENS